MKAEPIRKPADIEKFKNYFLKRGKVRDFAMVVVGLNTALRCSDILALTWKDVFDFKLKKFRNYIVITEKKTKKINKIRVNKLIINALKMLKKSIGKIEADGVLFKSQKGENKAISRIQMYRIIKKAADELSLEGNISCHSLRKTFGYAALKNGVSPFVIMFLFNHSSFAVTRLYLGIDQDEKDAVFLKLLI